MKATHHGRSWKRASGGFAASIWGPAARWAALGFSMVVLVSACSPNVTDSDEYVALQGDRDQLAAQLSEVQGQLNVSQSELEDAQAELDVAREEISEVRSELGDTETQLGASQQSLEAAELAFDEEMSRTAVLEKSLSEIEARVEVLEGESWREFCTVLQFPTHVLSVWRVNEVVLDGAPTGGSEWSEALGLFLPLAFPWGHPDRFDPCAQSMTAWFMNDDTWLYGLYFVPWDGPVDPDDEGGIMLFRGESCCGVDSDYGVVPSSTLGEFSGPWDAYGWDGVQWFGDLEASPPGTIDLEGFGSFDGSGYWFEWRKRLESGDVNDWVLKPGQTIGNVPTQTWFLAHLWDNSEQLSYEHSLTMTLATDPN